jgi:S-(hydroxymethyl)glutathione dehydrogenase/alcohol dehydrogenase
VKAAILSELNRPLEVLSGVQTGALRRGQVLVKLAYSGVCHSQLMEARGRRGADPYLPHLLGHEGTGKVVETGEGVTKVRPGDLVVLGWIKGRGLDGGGTQYRLGDRTLNAGGVTTFNESAVVSENRLTPLPAGVPLDVGVLLGCAVPTGAGIVANDLRPVPGSSIAVFGLGGIGMSALMATKLFDCKTVIAVDIAADKLAVAEAFGATHALDASQVDPVATIRELTGGAGVDYAVESSGRVRVIEQAFESVRRSGGVCVFASHPAHGERISLDPYDLICGKQIRGSWGGNCVPDDDIPKFAALYRAGKLPLEKLITRRYTLDRINEALDDLESGRVTRPLIEIDPALAAERT